MLTLWRPHTEMKRWNRDLDDFFNWPTRSRPQIFSPAVDIQEQEDSFVIKADLPGMSKDAIEIQVENDTLTLSGKREQSSEEENSGVRVKERSYGSFCRSFRLGPKVAVGEIDASYDNGVLTLKLPKAEEAKPHKIDVH